MGDADRSQVDEEEARWHAGRCRPHSVECHEPQLTAGTTFVLHLDLSDHATLVRTNCASPGFCPERQGMELSHAPVGVKTQNRS